MGIIKTYHGEWELLDARGMSTLQFSGTLSYSENEAIELELIHKPYSGSVALKYHYDVIWGTDARMQKYTLFGASMRQENDYTRFVFSIRFVLIGEHVKSLDDTRFEICTVKYPYLNRLALDSRISVGANQGNTHVVFDIGNRPPFLTAEIEGGLEIQLWGQLTDNIGKYSVTANQATVLSIESSTPVSLSKYLRTITEFSQFLSIALFAEQHPSEVLFKNRQNRILYPLLFSVSASTEPWVLPLIKYNGLKEKMPAILKEWHSNYEQVSPICSYLIRSIQLKDSFDAPDFLIVAQAMDGYFKRFINKKDGKDIQKYEHQIKILLKAFEGVDVVKQCKLDPSVLKQTRDKYSHLIPDDDKKITKAVEGEELYWLTQKCIVLLTCCILDMLGLTTEEINDCCNQSPIQQIVASIPIWLC